MDEMKGDQLFGVMYATPDDIAKLLLLRNELLKDDDDDQADLFGDYDNENDFDEEIISIYDAWSFCRS